MMNNPQFYILDVFAEEKYAGNQLAVFRNTANLTTEKMQKIAKEMNYSETTFITGEAERNGGFDVRIFTPEEEIPFAGHPTLGTAFVIQQEILKKPLPKVMLNLGVGQIPVSFSYQGNQAEMLWMQQVAPTFGEQIAPKELTKILNLEINDFNRSFPVQSVSTGLPFFIVPLNSLDAVKKARVDNNKYFDFISNRETKDILIFSPETYSEVNDLNARVFAGYHGVPEDPATGSANGCLAAYLVKNRFFGKNEIDIRVEQGYEMGRPSRLYLRAVEKQLEIEIFVGGRVILVAAGRLV